MITTALAAQPPLLLADTVKILIVDDEPKNLTVLETVLDDPGYLLIRANSGDEALMALMAHEFAVLVLDVRMPGMTGFELAQLIKERKKTAQIPIIFLTAYYNEDQHVLEGYGSGAVDYLHKPVNSAVLRSKVAVFAELHRKSRALEIANRALSAEISERRAAEMRLQELNENLDRQVTERTQALHLSETELRDVGRRKDEFLATLAHELRNPLAPVRNAVEVLRLKGGANAQTRWASEVIERQVQVMSRLVDDLMDVGRINQGRIELRRQPVKLSAILRDAIETIRPLIDEYGHDLVLAMPEPDVVVDADATRLAQAFMNLLNNAAKYTDPGGRIRVEVRKDGGEVRATITDSGIGIEPERLSSVFEMFSQVETALSRSRGGLGIGLSLAQRLIQMHGGRIEATSAGLGQGSQFEITLPLADVSDVSAAPSHREGDTPARATGGGLTVLVADDNLDAAATLAVLLEMFGHKVEQVHDGEAAAAAALRLQPDVVLLDIGMPKLNGYEACRQIRSQAGGAGMTLIALTGWGQPDDRQAAKSAGFDMHLVKPVDPELLAELLANVAPRTREI